MIGPWNQNNKTTVVHCQKKLYDIYCGRPSYWGNPFEIGKDGNREEVIKKYEDWIIIGDGQYLLKDIYKLKGKFLGCWCKPKNCHCDILALLADNFKIPKDININDDEVFKCYLDGFIACYNGKLENDNPYNILTGYDWWYNGYWDCANYLDHRKGKYNATNNSIS